MSGVFSLLPKRHFLQSHLDLCNIPCYIFHGCTPVILGEFSPFHACCTPSFPCACCHTAWEQGNAEWSPCGSCTPGMGAWNGSCTLNKRSVKTTRYLHLPWGWELMETQLWKCPGFPASSSVEHRESCSNPSDQVMVSGVITLTPTYPSTLVSSQRNQFPIFGIVFSIGIFFQFQFFSDPPVSLAGNAGQPQALPCLLNPAQLCHCCILRSEHSKVGSLCGTADSEGDCLAGEIWVCL